MNTDGNLAALAVYQRKVDDDDEFDSAVEYEAEQIMALTVQELMNQLGMKDAGKLDELIQSIAQDRVIARADDFDEPDDY